ncbi:hypothetical protein QTP70_015420, partial [Hemibagrus guttatus]
MDYGVELKLVASTCSLFFCLRDRPPLLCLLSAYSPQGALVSWTVDGSVVKDGVLTTRKKQKKDGYTRSSTLTLSKALWEQGEEFVCKVSHGGVDHPVTSERASVMSNSSKIELKTEPLTHPSTI